MADNARPADVVDPDPVLLAKAMIRAYAQLRLDVMLLLADSAYRRAATEIMNKVHNDAALDLQIPSSSLTVFMAHVFLSDSLLYLRTPHGGEDSAG